MLPFAVGWTFLLELPQKLKDNNIFCKNPKCKHNFNIWVLY